MKKVFLSQKYLKTNRMQTDIYQHSDFSRRKISYLDFSFQSIEYNVVKSFKGIYIRNGM